MDYGGEKLGYIGERDADRQEKLNDCSLSHIPLRQKIS